MKQKTLMIRCGLSDDGVKKAFELLGSKAKRFEGLQGNVWLPKQPIDPEDYEDLLEEHYLLFDTAEAFYYDDIFSLERYCVVRDCLPADHFIEIGDAKTETEAVLCMLNSAIEPLEYAAYPEDGVYAIIAR